MKTGYATGGGRGLQAEATTKSPCRNASSGVKFRTHGSRFDFGFWNTDFEMLV